MPGRRQRGESEVFALFTAHDRNHDGSIDREEFERLVTELGAGLAQEELDRAFADIDKNGDGAISFDELSGWWRHP